MDEGLRDVIVDNRNVLCLGVFDFPGGGLHLGKLGANHDFDVFTAKASGRSAAVHGGVAAAEHEHALANFVNVLEGH